MDNTHFYDYEFRPWRCNGPGGSTRFNADDWVEMAKPSTWEKPLDWHWKSRGPMEMAGLPLPKETLQEMRPRVLLMNCGKFFEEYEGGVRNSDGEQIWLNMAMGDTRYGESPGDGWKAMDMNDLIQGLFNLVDRTSNMDWIMPRWIYDRLEYCRNVVQQH